MCSFFLKLILLVLFNIHNEHSHCKEFVPVPNILILSFLSIVFPSLQTVILQQMSAHKIFMFYQINPLISMVQNINYMIGIGTWLYENVEE